MSLNDLNMDNVEEPKDFGAVKSCATQLRIKAIDKITEGITSDKYDNYFRVSTEFVDPSSVEPYDPNDTPSAPIVNLYSHNDGCLQMLRRFIEAHGFLWDDFKASPDREGFLQGLVGAEANVKLKVQTHRTDNGEELDRPVNKVSYRLPKKVA